MEEKTKILIVDDEPINLDFFEVMLTKLGFDVSMAHDGEEALEMIVNVKPDVVILDNIMPKLTGWEVTRILKTDEDYFEVKDTPIIMFSAMDDVKDKVEGFELGVEDYITKPFNFSEVLARIRAVLRTKQLSRQVLQKERYIAKIASLNDSLVYFTEHLKSPVEDLLTSARKLEGENPDSVQQFVEKVVSECEQVLAALGGLEEEVAELKKNGGENTDKPKEILDDLEIKFRKQFANMKQNEQLN